MEKTVKKRQSNQNPMEKIQDLLQFKSEKTDPLGSYTGRPADPGEVPVQDADDL